ncbi:hypothetical protein [Chelatococcus sambhunathii]|uniref:hypothetical protein n=1 Tax=Chelatococcus sambhunathii TaxID=363953 RepID=UPI000931D31F|nr:hypothetical protein [Chelatococcus sambhunathii]
MSYPQIIDYNEAVQDPRNAFLDPELKAGKVAETPLGLPLALSGGFALTYTVNSGPRKFAVRCFHRAVPEAQSRYAAISAKLRGLASPYFVNFDFQSQGIRVRGKPYPIVKMDWVEGDTLGIHLDRTASNAPAVASLRRAFSDLAAFLERNGIAHGDIQNENVIVENGALRLIDYDGMFVPGMQEGRGTEVGHKHFQHPGREPKHFGSGMDRFSFIVLDVSLEALHADPGLHRRFREGGQAIIFKANDFVDPASSEIFRVLNGMPALRESAKKFAAVCGASVSHIPTLSDFVVGRNIPIAIVPPVGAPKPVPPPTYIGAFDVVDAKDFSAVMRRVGDKIELVGQIVSVKHGVGKRGRGRGRPYVFINFGIWNRDSVKVTIWSEGLSNMSARPTESWTGKWISVTGLVEPPYEGKHYGKPYRNIGITVTADSQIVHISENEAKFRLGRLSKISRGKPDSKSRNAGILDGIRGGGTHTATPVSRGAMPAPSTAPISQSPKTKNEQILKGLQTAGAQTQVGGTRYSPPRKSAPSSPGLLARIPGWLWFVGVILLLILLTRGR